MTKLSVQTPVGSTVHSSVDTYSHGALKRGLCRKYQIVQTIEGKRCSDYYHKLLGTKKVLTAIPNLFHTHTHTHTHTHIYIYIYIYIYISVIRKF